MTLANELEISKPFAASNAPSAFNVAQAARVSDLACFPPKFVQDSTAQAPKLSLPKLSQDSKPVIDPTSSFVPTLNFAQTPFAHHSSFPLDPHLGLAIERGNFQLGTTSTATAPSLILLRKDMIIDWLMKGGIGPLYILWVNSRVADGKFTWDLAFRSDYLRWGSWSAGVFVCRLTLGWRIRVPSVESFLLDVRSTRTRTRSSVLVFQRTRPYLSTYCNAQARRHVENLQRLTSRWSAEQRTHNAQPKAFSAQPKACG